jgi:hypothetical protein
MARDETWSAGGRSRHWLTMTGVNRRSSLQIAMPIGHAILVARIDRRQRG